MLFREETRWPGYYYRADTPGLDQDNWKVFANLKVSRSTGEYEMIKRQIHEIF